ncbi:MAG: hypothetical protein OIF38_13130, partial [Cellvibrionaceae bacterium]|nr:hypothetical protein [Cellvibrionaceae bacterium]
YSQRYNAAGERVGEETQVNTYTQADQREPQMVALDNGGYAIVWMSNTQDGSGQGVYLRLYNSAGEPQGDEIQINNQTEHDQYLPTIASLEDGNIVVTWESADSSGQLDVYAQILSPTGEIIVDDFVVANGAQYQNRPFVAATADGGFAISYVDTDLDAGQQRTMLQRFNANGSASGAAILVSETSDMLAYKPEITGLQDGSVVITWVTLEDNPDHYDYQVMMARYDANGEQLLAPQSVTSPDMLQVEPHITSLNDGGYLITWTQNDLVQGSSTVVGQRFDADNQRIGEAFEVGQVFSPNHSIDSEQGDAVTDAETIDPGLIDTDLIDPEFNWGNELLEPEFDAELDLPELNLGDLLGDEAELDDLLATLPAPSASSTEAQPSEPAPSSTEPPAWDNLPMDDKWLACWDDISYMIP